MNAKQFSDQYRKHEYRLQFDDAGTIVAESRYSGLGERLGIALDGKERKNIFAHCRQFEPLAPELPGRLERRLRRLIADGEEFSLHGDCVTPEGEFHLHISGSVLSTFEGPSMFALLIVDDTLLTRTRRIHEYMFRLANHELKGPLACIAGAADFAEEHVARNSIEGVKTCLAMIQRNAMSMEEMIRRYLNLSRIESGEMKLHPREISLYQEVLNPLLSEIQPMLLTRETEVVFSYGEHGREPHVFADPEAATIVLRNLVLNAVSYGAPCSPVEINLSTNDETVISVKNQGPNIPEQQIKRLFEKFVRLDATQGGRGAGLGLYNSRKIVENWGGRIWAESQDNTTTFFFTIPEE